MTTLRDTLTRWQDAADIDWFSQFIKAWIPFNAWMTHTFGDLPDWKLIDNVKSSGNVVYNGIVPRLHPAMARSQDDNELRLQYAELHRLLQGQIINGRRGRISFETVDLGPNPYKDDSQRAWNRDFRVRRDHPNKGECLLEITATKTTSAFSLQISEYNWTLVEGCKPFQALEIGHQSRLKVMFESVSPRMVSSVLQPHGRGGAFKYGTTDFIPDPPRLFSALVDVVYGLRNALFHGSITPNRQHNEIYEPAYNLVMRFVRCTI